MSFNLGAPLRESRNIHPGTSARGVRAVAGLPRGLAGKILTRELRTG